MLSRKDRDPYGSGDNRARQTEADIVVSVVRLVVVALRRAEILWIVVPGTAAKNAVDRAGQGLGRVHICKPRRRRRKLLSPSKD